MLRRRGFSLVIWWLAGFEKPSYVRASIIRQIMRAGADTDAHFEALVNAADFNELFSSVTIPEPIGGIIVEVDETLHDRLAALDRAHDPNRFRKARHARP